MEKKHFWIGRLLLLVFVVFILGIVYKRPKEYLVIEDPIKMCDETGEKVIEVTCDLYIQRYFFKGSEIRGVIFVNGVKYTSLFDSEQFGRGVINGNDFSAKLAGRKYTMPFINEEYYMERAVNGLRTDWFFDEESIRDFSLTEVSGEKIILFSFPGMGGDVYFGPAKNAAEYDEVMRKAGQKWMEQ